MPPSTKSKPSSSSSSMYPASPELSIAFRKSISEWFRKHQRSLPWRHPLTVSERGSLLHDTSSSSSTSFVPLRDPYGTWVCEVMSQQTRIQTVVDYWPRWMAQFPTVEALAAADANAVRAMWTGMGFYRRAEFLHKGAQHVVATLGGVIPNTAKALQGIPGVGPYTAGAIASICFDEAAPAVDGNAMRVLSRLGGIRDFDPKASGASKVAYGWNLGLLTSASTLSTSKANDVRFGDITEGLLELGATVCKPNGAPECGKCPLSSICRAKAMLDAGDIEEIDGVIPLRGKKVSVTTSSCVSVAHYAWSHHNKAGSEKQERDTLHMVLTQRPAGGLLGSMFEVPSVETTLSASSATKTKHSNTPPPLPQELMFGAVTITSSSSTSSSSKKTKREEAQDDCCVHVLPKFVHRFSHIHLEVFPFAVHHPDVLSLQQMTKKLPTTKQQPAASQKKAEERGPNNKKVNAVLLNVVSEQEMGTSVAVAKTVEKIVALIKKHHCGNIEWKVVDETSLRKGTKVTSAPRKRPRSDA